MRTCCLPAGSTHATLLDEWEPLLSSDNVGQYQDPEQKWTYPTASQPQKQAGDTDQAAYPQDNPCKRLRKLRNLQPGAVVIFEEVIGPETGKEADADPSHRQAVRLTRVEFSVDRLFDQPVVEIEWASADALPFPLCISTTSDAPDCLPLHDVSVICGNVILVDHGRHQDEPLGCVPVVDEGEFCEEDCYPNTPQRIPGVFRPKLKDPVGGGELTFTQPLPAGPPVGCPPNSLPASEFLQQDPRQALPWITLTSQPDPACRPTPTQEPAGSETPATTWVPRPDLLSSSNYDAHFVVEMDNARRAHLRFGDGELGRRPEGWTSFQASYRVGNGKRGNVGAETILHLVFRQNPVSGLALSLCNPLPAQGGADPEPLEEAKLFAPHAFRLELARAITAVDYAAIVMRDFSSQVQRAAAALRWMGSWYEVLVAVDPRGQEQASSDLLNEIAMHLEDYRRIGHDVTVSQAEYVPLEIDLLVCVLPGYLRGHVKASLLDLLSNRRLRDGSRGYFHPDSLSFGEGVYLSRLIAAVQAVAGVESVTVNVFKRLFEEPNQEIENGLLLLGPLEVARLDNDPNIPENGKLTLTLRGGR